MPRQTMTRRVRSCTPAYSVFKPACRHLNSLNKCVMTLDELEALCLSDCEDMYQAAAAEQMGVSRQTYAKILKAARKKVMKMLRYGNALVIEGGNVCSCDNEDDTEDCFCKDKDHPVIEISVVQEEQPDS